MTRPINVHVFPDDDDSGDAYNESQWRPDIKMGDVLVVPSERVVGFMLSAWPVAVTRESGSFHSRQPKFDWARMLSPPSYAPDEESYRPSYHRALEVAVERGYPLDLHTGVTS